MSAQATEREERGGEGKRFSRGESEDEEEEEEEAMAISDSAVNVSVVKANCRVGAKFHTLVQGRGDLRASSLWNSPFFLLREEKEEKLVFTPSVGGCALAARPTELRFVFRVLSSWLMLLLLYR